jgi:hypothetical protein
MDIQVLDNNPLYANQTYRLKFKFSPQYPIGSLFFSPLELSRATAISGDGVKAGEGPIGATPSPRPFPAVDRASS